MKALIAGVIMTCSLTASYMPNQPLMHFDSIDTVKVVCIYALGEWSDATKHHHYSQNTPLRDYAFNIWDTLAPAVPHYYKTVSAGKFKVNSQVWHNNGKPYVMQGFWTPMHPLDTAFRYYWDSLFARIDRENVWSFAQNAMMVNDTPVVWVFVLWPDTIRSLVKNNNKDTVDTPYIGGWGVAPQQPRLIPVNEYVNGKQVFVHVFGLSRQPSKWPGDAVAGVVHEINHQWFPDIGYNPDHYGLGGFDPEAAGCGFYDDEGGLPSPLNPKWRCEAGWATLFELNREDHLDRIIQDETKDTLYKFGDFYISAHLQQSYYESKWPGQGLLIWHLRHTGETGFNYACESQWFGDFGYGYMDKPLDLEAAHGLWQWSDFTHTNPDPVYGRDNLDKKGYYSKDRGFKGVGDAECFFSPVYGTTQFDGLTNPSSRGHEFNAQGGVTGEKAPQEIALRRLQLYGNAMKADFLYHNCIPSRYPGISIHSGTNNQHSLVPSISYTSGAGYLHQLYAYAYVDNDPMLWIRIADGFLNLPNVSRQLIYQGDSASYPSLYSYGSDKSKLAISWLDGSSLYYREGYKILEDTVRWDINAFDLSTLGDWPGFTAPAMVVGAGDTVFVAAVVSYTTFIPTGQGPTYLPILCFKFHKWHPEDAHVDTLAMFEVDTIAGLGIGSSVALALDSYSRVHSVYKTSEGDNLVLWQRYLVPGDSIWHTPIRVTPTTSGFDFVGAPCLEFYDGYLNLASSAARQGKLHLDVYYTNLNVTGAELTGPWMFPIQISNDFTNAYDPIVKGGSVTAGDHHFFWSEGGEILYRNGLYAPIDTVSRTSHAWSNAPQAIYDGETENCYLAWRESNLLGSEIDLRTITAGGGGFGGEQSAGKSLPAPLKLELSTTVYSQGELRITYVLPAPSKNTALGIYDCQGRLIYRWTITSGSGTIQWNGCDREHRAVASGVYFICMFTPERQLSKKIAIVR